MQQLREAGFIAEEKLAPGTYLFSGGIQPVRSVCEQWGFTGIGVVPASIKTDPRLFAATLPDYALQQKDKVKVMVATVSSLPSGRIRQILTETGLTVSDFRGEAMGIYGGYLEKNKLEPLASLPIVTAVQMASPADRTLNDRGRASSGTSLLQRPLAQGGRDLTGAGVTVGVGDDADPTLHPDLTDRVINHTPGLTNNHGAHVTGTVAGAGILTPRVAGYAPKATIVSQYFSGIWANAGMYTQQYNMVVTNNSYGSLVGDCVYAGVYDLNSRLLDEQASIYPQLLHTFAAGNDGDLTCTPFPKAYGTVLGGYQSAKNILTVGRTDYTQVSSSSSSSGPVKDGRLKPEITGLGIITSLNGAGTGYFTEFGTSQSAPNITGGLALLYQRYRQMYNGANPRGALIKAILLNGARDVGNPGPDFRHGYGTMMLERSLRILEKKYFTERGLAQGQVQDTVITLSAGIKQLKVMLYWHDPAASTLANQTLVHDLDLEVLTPGGQIIKPWVLNAQAPNADQPATRGEDHTNNHEQVVLELPDAGNYILRVKGTEILTKPQQDYALVFDYLPQEIRFTHPVQGQVAEAGSVTLPIAWEDESNIPGNYTLSYSLDNGNTWVDIAYNIKDSTRLFFWQPGSIRSTQARLRITKGSQSALSETFALIPNLAFSAAPVNDQCYGYFRINWNPLTPSAGETIDYVIKLKRGAAMDSVATVSGQNFFILSNLNPDSTYYAAVVARINGISGWYAEALRRQPNTGNCAGNISDNNLMLDSIVSPLPGRLFTTSALGTLVPIVIRIRNLDNMPVPDFTIKYSLNGGPFTEATPGQPIAARSTFTYTFPGIDMSASGTYRITAIVINQAATDPQTSNDTLQSVIIHFPNEPIVLNQPFSENFEAAAVISQQQPTMGVAGLSRWDYGNTDPMGRLRTFVTPDVYDNGQRAITLDVSKARPPTASPFNTLTGTFNLSGYDVNIHQLRLTFRFKHHGIAQLPHPLNKVWVRGSDTNPWIELIDLGALQTPLGGFWQTIAGIDLSGKLKAAGQQFSSGTQIRFGQVGFFSMADNENFAGYTFDDLMLIIAQNDASVTEIVSPMVQNCTNGNNIPITIKVYNSMPAGLGPVPVRYRLNGGAWTEENIPAIPARDTVTFSFTTLPAWPTSGNVLIEAEAVMPGDNITENNLKRAGILLQPIVGSLPYYQDFEQGPAGFLSNGINNTWEMGKPASLRINTAASGQHAWKTRLAGDYRNLEFSYLYTPCFNISGLSNPMLGFYMAFSFEDCRNFNFVCDAGWVEYSLDGTTWQKLGRYGEGDNWYDYEAAQVWMRSDQTQWREVISPLPAHNGVIRLRFVIQSDLGSTREGMAIDNVHVFNGGALPLNWLWFVATSINNGDALLRWKVFNRSAGDRFTVQVTRQENASDDAWETIATLQARAGDGGQYMYTDNRSFKSGLLLYRIEWKKMNGEVSYSPVRKLMYNADTTSIILYPNPADTWLQVQARMNENEMCTITLLSSDGKRVFTMKQAATDGFVSARIDLHSFMLPAGLYLVEVSNGTQRKTAKWIKP